MVIRVSRVHCVVRVSGSSRDTKYLNSKSRLWVIERSTKAQVKLTINRCLEC